MSKVIIPVSENGLLFANFFAVDLPNERSEFAFDVPLNEKYSDKYTLQTEEGISNRQRYLAKTHGLGYVQTGNMSVEIWKKKTNDQVLIVETWEEFDPNDNYSDAENERLENEFDTERDKFKKDYSFVGEVSCEVWRIEFIDASKITNEIRSGHKFYGRNPHEIIAKLLPGNYEITELYEDRHTSNKPFCIWCQIQKVAD